MQSSIRRSFASTVCAVGVVSGLGAIGGCAQDTASPSGDIASENTGSVGLELQLGATTLDVLSYTITGPGGFTRTGTINLRQSDTLTATIGGLPVGMGFTIKLSGTASDGTTTCSGSATFDVAAGATTGVPIHLTCHERPRNGGISLDGSINVCPVIDGVSAVPASALVGGTVALSAVAHDSDHGPSPLSYQWSAVGGTLSSPSAQNPTFTCGVAGAATIKLTVSDGDPTAGCAATSSVTVTCTAPPTLAQVGHVVVIYLENWSFDSLYGSFPGAEGLSSPSANIPQIDNTTGLPYTTLPEVDPNVPTTLPNQPFDLTQYVPESQRTVDLVHRFFQEQGQIDNGKMDKFVTISDAKGLAMSYYPTASLPLVQFINSNPDQATVCDHFFHAAFGGSFLNHMWLIAAQSPVFPNAPAAITIQLDANGGLVKDGQVTPDGFAVNTSFSVNAPHPASANPANLVPNQTFPTIGDSLTAAGVDWAWYAGGWNNALAGTPDGLYQFHHQPFIYFANYADGTAAKAAHLKDETDFTAAVAAGSLPAVSFVKPLGPNNEHPGYADLVTGEQHTVALIQSIQQSPLWSDTVVIVTYDEHGGRWDHVPPPVVDRWGPGSRVPAIVFSRFAKGGVDPTPYDTTAILKLIETRWNLAPLAARDAAQADLSSHALVFGASNGTGGSDGGTPGADTGAGADASVDAAVDASVEASTDGGAGTPTTAAVQAILNANCTICHSGANPPQGLDWTNVRAQIGVASNECPLKNRITAGDAAHSYVIDKLRGAAQDGLCFVGQRMPAGSPPLADGDIALIAAWINAGAP